MTDGKNTPFPHGGSAVSGQKKEEATVGFLEGGPFSRGKKKGWPNCNISGSKFAGCKELPDAKAGSKGKALYKRNVLA